jgi:FMN phosphatase YigB (HAD superfamily)
MKYTYSFDIFDTCLVRTCGSPQMVFSLMAQKLSNERAFIPDFVKRRLQAETDAQIQLKKEAITIGEIYDYFDLQSLNLNKLQIIDMEMSVEEQLLYPVYTIREQVNDIHSAGHTILYVSDMYLPASFLEKILTKWGFWRNGDRLFVSGEYGAAKHTGNLYRYISRELNIPFKRWHHYGDNSIADVRIPRKLGIKAHKIKNDYSRYEKQWIKNAAQSFDPEMCRYFAGCARAVRLSNKQDERVSLAADVIAPVYIPFVFYVLDNAKEKGITHLYFIARDSYIFYRIALQLSHLFPEIKLSYIYLSRRALWLPSLYDCNKKDYEGCLDKIIATGWTPEKLLNMFNIPLSEISEYAKVSQTFWQKPLTKDTVDVFYSILLLPAVKDIIKRRSLQARELLLAYLKQEYLLDDTAHSAIVDLGWSGTSRSALNKILLKEGYNPVYTYYWGVFGAGRILYDYKKPYGTYLYMEELSSSMQQDLIAIMEHYFSVTTQCSTVGYISSGNTIDVVFNNNDYVDAVEIADANLKIVEQTVDLLMHFSNIENRIKYSFMACGLPSLETFIEYPLYDETKLFKKIIGVRVVKSGMIVQPLNLWDILMLILFNYHKAGCWGSGSLVAVSSLYGWLLNNIYQNILNMKQVQKLIQLVIRIAKTMKD